VFSPVPNSSPTQVFSLNEPDERPLHEGGAGNREGAAGADMTGRLTAAVHHAAV